jgi:hypothetical protein
VIITTHVQAVTCPDCQGKEFDDVDRDVRQPRKQCERCSGDGILTEDEAHDRILEIKRRMPESLRDLLVGPFRAGVNGYVQYFFMTSGSGKGWPTNIAHEWYCRLLMDEFTDDAILVTFGDEVRPELQVKHRPPPTFEVSEEPMREPNTFDPEPPPKVGSGAKGALTKMLGALRSRKSSG